MQLTSRVLHLHALCCSSVCDNEYLRNVNHKCLYPKDYAEYWAVLLAAHGFRVLYSSVWFRMGSCEHHDNWEDPGSSNIGRRVLVSTYLYVP